MKKWIILAFGVSILSVFNAEAQKISKTELAELDKAERAIFKSFSDGDSSAFRKLSGVDYYSINANGTAAELDEAVSSVPLFKGSVVELFDQKQRVYGDVALRTGHAKFFLGGQLVAEALYTSGWVYHEKSWKFVHWQGTPTGILIEGKGMGQPRKN